MISLNLNGTDVEVDAPSTATLLNVLSNDLNEFGPKYGCGKSQCGACTVLLDGTAVRSCQTAASAASGRRVTTLSGLTENGEPSPLQRAFIEEQAAQCGFCISGMIMQAQALLEANPNPTDADIRQALNGNLCRCGTHNRIVRAVLRAAEEA